MAEEVTGPVVQPVNKTYNTIEPTVKAKRVPRRVLHFSDGVIEEFSTDEEEEKEEEERKKEAERQVPPHSWIYYRVKIDESRTCHPLKLWTAMFWGWQVLNMQSKASIEFHW